MTTFCWASRSSSTGRTLMGLTFEGKGTLIDTDLTLIDERGVRAMFPQLTWSCSWDSSVFHKRRLVFRPFFGDRRSRTPAHSERKRATLRTRQIMSSTLRHH